jgi:hypothetical protein
MKQSSEKGAVAGNVKNVRLTGAEGARSLDKSDCRGEFTRRRDIFCKNTSRGYTLVYTPGERRAEILVSVRLVTRYHYRSSRTS